MDDQALVKLINAFEKKIKVALEFKYQKLPEVQKRFFLYEGPLGQLDLKRFFDLYKSQHIYPQERLEKVVNYLFDIKLQLFFLLEVDLPLYNKLVYDPHQNKKIEDCPYLLLAHLSIDQTLIFKTRVLWERLMNLIYYLETGTRLEDRRSRKRSKRAIFTKFIKEKATRWSFILDYQGFVDKYDECFRTAEAHKESRLRVYFFKNQAVDFDVNSLILFIMMNIWNDIYDLIQGKRASRRYWSVGMKKIKS